MCCAASCVIVFFFLLIALLYFLTFCVSRLIYLCVILPPWQSKKSPCGLNSPLDQVRDPPPRPSRRHSSHIVAFLFFFHSLLFTPN
jgi:Ca2+/Na+ antiporter